MSENSIPVSESSSPASPAASEPGGGPIPASAPVVVAVDAMGGDYAPREIVKGALQYLQKDADGDNGVVLLVGDPAAIEAELVAANAPAASPRLRIIPASQVIEMNEHPTEAFKEKQDSSLVLCNKLVRIGQAHAAFSAGNTGAMMVAATFILQRIEQIRRPAIATLFPKETGGSAVVVDAGANVDCRPEQLVQFALLGSIYAEKVLRIPSPRVGLLSNGEEDSKGNQLVQETRELLRAEGSRINFVGNVEGNHVFEGGIDVVVCDGFVGNVLLKGAEGVVRLVLSLLAADAKSEPDEEKRDALLKSLLRLRQRVDYSENGGAPLLGVNGAAFIAHGRSDANTIATGIRIAARATRSGYVASIRDAMREMKGITAS